MLKEYNAILMDSMFARIVDSNLRRLDSFNPSPVLYAKQMNIDISLAGYLFGLILQYGHENDLLVAQKSTIANMRL